MKYRLILLVEALVYIYAHSKRSVLDLYKWKCFPAGSRPDVQFNFAMDCGFNGQLIISMKSMKKDIQGNGQRKRTTGQTMIYKTLHSKQKTEQHDHTGQGLNRLRCPGRVNSSFTNSGTGVCPHSNKSGSHDIKLSCEMDEKRYSMYLQSRWKLSPETPGSLVTTSGSNQCTYSHFESFLLRLQVPLLLHLVLINVLTVTLKAFSWDSRLSCYYIWFPKM